MTVAAAHQPGATVVLLAEPGAGRARRLMLALEGLGVAPAQVDEATAEAVEAAEGEGDAPQAPPAVDLAALHEQVLDDAGVRADDARPAAWADVAAAVDTATETAITAWLQRQLAATATPLVADRRLHWLLPVWLRACSELGVRATVVIAPRRPDLSAESQAGAPTGGRPAHVAAAAAWLNQTLHVERATRAVPRVVVPTSEVAADWVAATARIADALDLAVIRDAAATKIRSTQQALDRAPATAVEPGEQVALPTALHEQVEAAWQLLVGGGPGDTDALDAARARFTDYYLEAESVAVSSVRAARGRAPVTAPAPAAAGPAPAAAAEPPPPSRSPVLPWRRSRRSRPG